MSLPTRDLVPFRTALRAWFAISLQTFGGPAGQIAVMHRALVDDKRWIGERRFQHALNYCMLLPGPEAQQLAIYTGWLLNGLRGGLAAGTLFVLPGAAAIFALSAVYVAFGDTTVVAGVFAGLGPAVIAIVVQAVLGVAKRALTNRALVALAIIAFLALTLLNVPFPLVILAAAVAGWLLSRGRRSVTEPEPDGGPQPLIPDDALHAEPPSRRRLVRILLVGLLAWSAPIALVALLTGTSSTTTTQGLFFSGTALVTFGGAYAVLAFVADQAVNTYHWVTADQMVRGLGLAETTPGPLIMVLQFVAFLGAYANPGELNPWVAGTIGALLTTWVTFVPSFLFVFLGAPSIERLRGNAALTGALSGITAAVVGVIASLALYLTTHTLFAATVKVGWLELPDLTAPRPVAVVLAAFALVVTLRLRWSVPRTLGLCAVLGLAVAFIAPTIVA
jgi:chromate transporter